MQTESDIQDRIRYLLSVELSQRVEKARKRLPHHCKHNYQHLLDVRKKVNGEPNEVYNKLDLSTASEEVIRKIVVEGRQTVGLCMVGQEDYEHWDGAICEDPIDAQRCPLFDPILTKENIEETFFSQIRDLDWVQENLPEVYGLLWALGSETVPNLPWWKLLWFKLLKIRPDPLISSDNVP